MGPYNQMQIVVARELVAKWKQPVPVDSNKKMTDEILINIIRELHAVRYTVVGISSMCM